MFLLADLAQRWAELADHPLVGEARCKGLVGALELVADKDTRTRFPDVAKFCQIASMHEKIYNLLLFSSINILCYFPYKFHNTSCITL